MARLAYCDFDALLETALDRVDFRLLAPPFQHRGTQAFLAEGREQALLVFRGSDEPLDWINNLRIELGPWRGRGRVHCGFADSLEAVWPEVEAALQQITRPLLITGHSLGGALASLAASLVPHEELITFGAPKVGDAEFCASLGSARRFVNNEDLVCRLPPTGVSLVQAYGHAGQLVLIGPTGETSQPAEPTSLDRFDVSLDRVWEMVLLGLSAGRLPRMLMDHAPINYVSALA